MAFPREPTRAPDTLEDFDIFIKTRRNDDGTITYDEGYEVVVKLTNGERVRHAGRLSAHLTDQQKLMAKNFIDSLRAKAESEIL